MRVLLIGRTKEHGFSPSSLTDNLELHCTFFAGYRRNIFSYKDLDDLGDIFNLLANHLAEQGLKETFWGFFCFPLLPKNTKTSRTVRFAADCQWTVLARSKMVDDILVLRFNGRRRRTVVFEGVCGPTRRGLRWMASGRSTTRLETRGCLIEGTTKKIEFQCV